MEKHNIKINLPGLLKMLGSNIYAEPDVAIREMIQNAHDACLFRKTNDPKYKDPKIHISLNKEEKSITFFDNGTGMTESELHKYLSTIGASLTKIRRDELSSKGRDEAFLLVGQFGIGLLSAFSVAEKVEVFTKSYLKDSYGLKWTCEGDIDYTIEKFEMTETGTRLVLYLNDKSLVLLNNSGLHIKRIIQKYANFLPTPIALEDHGQVNKITTPWQIADPIELNKYIKDRYNLEAIEIIRLNLTEPIRVEGILFIPLPNLDIPQDFGEVDLYVSRMFISEKSRDLLPEWAKFIKGILNLPSLTPTTSRDSVVKDDEFQKVRKTISDVILNHLEKLTETRDAQKKLEIIMNTYNASIKNAALHDDAFFKRMAPLVRVMTENGKVTMQQYLAHSNDIIYYFSERGGSTQHKLLFSAKGLAVIDASFGAEEEFLEKYAHTFGKQIRRLEAESNVLFENPENLDTGWQTLEFQFKSLGVESKAVSFEPSTIPAILVEKPLEKEDKFFSKFLTFGEERGLSSAELRHLFDEARINKTLNDQQVLHINMKNGLMLELRNMAHSQLLKPILTLIYNNALVFSQKLLTSENHKKVFESNSSALGHLFKDSQRVLELQDKISQMDLDLQKNLREIENERPQLFSHRSCFFAYPFQPDFHGLRDELRKIFSEEYGIELFTASEDVLDSDAVTNIKTHIARSHFGIADITGNNPNVFWELGFMIGLGKPVILLKNQKDKSPTPFDVYGRFHCEYSIASNEATGDVEYALLKAGIKRALEPILKENSELHSAKKYSN